MWNNFLSGYTRWLENDEYRRPGRAVFKKVAPLALLSVAAVRVIERFEVSSSPSACINVEYSMVKKKKRYVEV